MVWWPFKTQSDRIEDNTKELLRKVQVMQEALNNLATQVAELATVAEGAVATLHGLGDLMREAAGNEAKVRELADAVDATEKKLAAAILANTPAAPTEEAPTTEQPSEETTEQPTGEGE